MKCPYDIKEECDKTHLMKRLVWAPLKTPDATVCNNCILTALFWRGIKNEASRNT